jgi:superfamily II DNA or RNA helicase
LLTTVTELAAQSGSKLDLTDERTVGLTQAFTCSAVLTGPQQAAVQVLTGIARSGGAGRAAGTGKTVMACAVIAAHQVSTLVLVDRKTLADQWRARIAEFLGVKAGQLGGGRSQAVRLSSIRSARQSARKVPGLVPRQRGRTPWA